MGPADEVFGGGVCEGFQGGGGKGGEGGGGGEDGFA